MPHRGQQSTDGTGDGELAVPMAWLYAEYIADELLRSGDLMPPTSFEFRAGREALALTVFLSATDGELSGIRVITQLETWLSLTAYDQPWQEWVGERLAHLTAEAATATAAGRTPVDPDLELARSAWRWLRETELLAPDLNAVPGGAAGAGEDEGPKVWTPAWQLGLPLGHLAIHLF
ncbi:hypothetical protein [Streptomyces sp. NEAU-W12]|uniref:hypothetical protein n=1 Tax=Streptomyces sp. NEAU-W12 TaxID=2994668 RepID=UPI00224B9B0B|nr:hypothetical protein [Streptomyces sp. NEAU-W12]MCX2923381.1 hypothetical protein [Streptomyces sp. NEAU-W12]